MSTLCSTMNGMSMPRGRKSQRNVARVLAGMDDFALNSLGKSREGLTRGPF